MVMSGTAASLASAAVGCAVSWRESRAPWAAVNAVSHWFHGPRAYGANRLSLRHTLTGFAVHHASSMFWAALFELLLRDRSGRAGDDADTRTPRGGAAHRWTTAAAVTAIGAFTDLRLVPPRLSPGFEHRLSKPGLALVYLGFACGLALGSPRCRRQTHASR